MVVVNVKLLSSLTLSLTFVSEFNPRLDSLVTTRITQNNWHHGRHSGITSMYHQLTSQKQHGDGERETALAVKNQNHHRTRLDGNPSQTNNEGAR